MGGWSVIVPEATTNLCENPSFETGTTGWSASGTNTIARSTAVQQFGAYSLLCTYQNNTTLATYAVGSGDLSTSTTYTVTVRLYVPAGWDGGDIQITAANFTGATVTQVREWDSASGDTAVWVGLETTLALTSDAVGDVQVATTSAPTAGKTVYIDGLQIEAKAYATTYCDGDLPGCSWTGTPHATTSSRSATERSGGRVQDIQSDWGIQVRNWFGVGTPPMILNSQEQALNDGSLPDTTKYGARNFSLGLLFNEADAVNFHNTRRTMIRAVATKIEGVNEKMQPAVLRYTGKTEPVEIKARYAGGLELPAPKVPYFEETAVRFKADDPFFYQVGEKGAALDTNDSATFRLVAKRSGDRSTPIWDNLGPPDAAGTYTGVYAFAEDDTYIYIGGNFLNWDGIANADYIVRMNKSTGVYSALGSGMNGIVFALTTAPNGDIYAGGGFTTAGGSSANYIAKWDGSAWSALGSGMNQVVHALTTAPNGEIYAGGIFTTAGGSSANYIAKWDGSVWSALGSGMNSFVYSLQQNISGVSLYAGGAFTEASGITANRIAKWNGSAWSSIDYNHASAISFDAILLSDNGDIYLGMDASGTAAYAGTTTISYSGTAVAFPYMTVKRSGGTSAKLISIRNETTGAILYFDYDLLDGETLTIDLRPKQTTITSSFFGSVPSAILPNSNTTQFFLAPGASGSRDNVVTAFVDEAGSPTVTALLYYKEAYLSID